MASSSYSIGIDLGTASTCTAIFRNPNAKINKSLEGYHLLPSSWAFRKDNAVIIPHEGEPLMPSYVAFTETGHLVGSTAKSQAVTNPKNTIYGALKFIGKSFSDPEISKLIKDRPFRVTERMGKPAFVVHDRDTELVITPIEILAMILARARTDAQSYLGQSSSAMYAVIAVPSWFDMCQRQAIWDAAQRAQLIPLGLISPAVSHSNPYASAYPPSKGRNVLVVDFGAGTLDVALASHEWNTTIIKATAGDYRLPDREGEIRTYLMRYIVSVVNRQDESEITLNLRALHRLRTACKKVKQELSSEEHESIEIDHLCDGHDFAMIEPVGRVLRDARMATADIHTVVVTGGSSRIPKIPFFLSTILDGMSVSLCQFPGEAVARGAALHADILSGDASSGVAEEILLMDAAPFSIGIETCGAVATSTIKRNTTVATKIRQKFSALEGNQNSFLVSVFEGERAQLENKIVLGKSELRVPPAPHNVPEIELTVDYDANGIVIVDAMVNGTSEPIHVSAEVPDRITQEELESMMVEAEKFDLADEPETRRVEKSKAVEGYVRSVLDDLASQPQTVENRQKTDLANTLREWLDVNQRAPASEWGPRLRNFISAMTRAIDSSAREDSDNDPDISTRRTKTGCRTCRRRKKKCDEAKPDCNNCTRGGFICEGYPDETNDIATKLNVTFNNSEQLPEQHNAPDTYNAPLSSIMQRTTLGTVGRELESSRASPLSPPVPTASDIVEDPNTLRSDAPRPTERSIAELFSMPNEGHVIYTDAEFIRISTYLSNIGKPSWSIVPRLYTLLRLINHLDMLDKVIEQGITDIWFPFTQTSLPHALSPTARAHFLDHQKVVLSKSLLFEKDSDRRHAHFASGEPLPFQVAAKLGTGAHAQVDKVMSTVSGREYARKLFRRQRGVSNDAIRSFLVELQALKRVHHHHCIELVQSYTDPRYFALLMAPVAECDLYKYYDLARNSPDKLSLLRSFFGCLANALQYIHNIKIRHRDIKPQNVLVKGERVLLSDFGIAHDWEDLSRSTTTADSGKTWIYAAPEVVRYGGKRNSAADVWSLGCVFFEIATVLKGETIAGMRAFFTEPERSENPRFYANIENLPKWTSKLREMGSAEDKDNVIFKWTRAMLHEKAEDRPTAATLYADIAAECTALSLPFCGSCCLDAVDSSGVEDEDGDDAWGQAAA